MHSPQRQTLMLTLAWLVVTLAGAGVVMKTALEHERTGFVIEAQGLHRLLAQQVRQQRQMFESLARVTAGAMPSAQWSQAAQSGPSGQASQASAGSKPLDAALSWLAREAHQSWPEPLRTGLAQAEARAALRARAAAYVPPGETGHYWLVRPSLTGAWAAQFFLGPGALEGAAEPFAGRSDVRAWLEQDGQRLLVLRASSEADEPGGWRLGFRQRLTQDDLTFDVVVVRRMGWATLPWSELGLWAALTCLCALLLTTHLLRARAARQTAFSADSHLTLGRSIDDDPLAHASHRAAAQARFRADPPSSRSPLLVTLRELDVEPPELTAARGAIRHASQQARRTSEVIAGMRRKLEDADNEDTQIQEVAWDELLRDALDLLQLDCERLQVGYTARLPEAPCLVMADPVVSEQLVRRLLGQALAALQQLPVGERQLSIQLQIDGAWACLSICDSSVHPDQSPEENSLNQRLAESIGAKLSTVASAQLGTVYRLSLPIAQA